MFRIFILTVKFSCLRMFYFVLGCKRKIKPKWDNATMYSKQENVLVVTFAI